MSPDRYNIRVYGICINDRAEVLVTDERRGSVVMTKFPGGGHHLGEGLADTIRREFKEETEMDVEVLELYYINDFLQISAFNPKEQLLSIYYLVRPISDPSFAVSAVVHDFPDGTADCQTFRWVPMARMDANDFTFPVDKVIAEKISKANPSKQSFR